MKGLFAWEPGCFISGHQNLDVAVEFISFQSSSKQTHSANYSNYLTFVHMSFVEIAVNANSFKLINHIQLFNYFDKNSRTLLPLFK